MVRRVTRAELDEGVDSNRRAIGPMISGLTSTATTSGRDVTRSDNPTSSAVSCSPIDGRLAAELAEQLLGGQLVDHLLGVDLADRRRPELDVGDRLGDDASDTQHDVGPELRVTGDTGDQLAISGDHRSDEQRHVAVCRRGSGQQLRRRAGHGVGVAESQLDQSTLGLVSDRGTAQLDRDGVAELVGGRDGGLRTW